MTVGWIAEGNDRFVRCHLWRWGRTDGQWDQRHLIVGGISPIGLLVAACTAAASSAGNRRRRDAAILEAAPRWRYATTGSAQIADGHLVFVEANGITRSFDLRTAVAVDEPTHGWIRFQPAGSSAAWAVQLTS